MDIGSKLKTSRIKAGLTQETVAEKIGVSRQTISNWENNNILPSINMLIRIATFFSVSSDYLLELDNRKFIEVEGLTLEEISHIQQIINDIKKTRNA